MNAGGSSPSGLPGVPGVTASDGEDRNPQASDRIRARSREAGRHIAAALALRLRSDSSTHRRSRTVAVDRNSDLRSSRLQMIPLQEHLARRFQHQIDWEQYGRHCWRTSYEPPFNFHRCLDCAEKDSCRRFGSYCQRGSCRQFGSYCQSRYRKLQRHRH